MGSSRLSQNPSLLGFQHTADSPPPTPASPPRRLLTLCNLYSTNPNLPMISFIGTIFYGYLWAYTSHTFWHRQSLPINENLHTCWPGQAGLLSSWVVVYSPRRFRKASQHPLNPHQRSAWTHWCMSLMEFYSKALETFHHVAKIPIGENFKRSWWSPQRSPGCIEMFPLASHPGVHNDSEASPSALPRADILDSTPACNLLKRLMLS